MGYWNLLLISINSGDVKTMELKKEVKMAEEKEIKTDKAVKKETKEAKIVEVPSQFMQVIELEDGEQVGIDALIVRMYNDIQKIKKSVA